jgi:hypothetical protein
VIRSNLSRLLKLINGVLPPSIDDTEPLDLDRRTLPTIVLENDRPEWGYLSETALMAFGVYISAVAAKVPVVRLRNPPGSGALLVLESVFVGYSTGSAFTLKLGSATADLATPGYAVSRDTRLILPLSGKVGIVSSVADNVALGNTFLVGQCPTGVTTILPVAAILAPGSHLEFAGSTVNLSVAIALFWRERLALKGELPAL